VGVYKRWTHIQLAFQSKKATCPNSFSRQTCDKTKEETNVERWGITSAKGGHDGGEYKE
jgi:hypothetical protein